jgi:hypothetical protein
VTKKRRLAIIVAVAVVVLGVCAVSAYAALSDDNTPPVTTSDAVATYWNSATITLSATDASGVAYIYYHVDGRHQYTHMFGVATDTPPFTVTIAGPTSSGTASHTLKFWAQDAAGNVEAANTVTLTVNKDTTKPTVKAPAAATVRRGHTATLKYSVADAAPTQGMATVTIKVKNHAGKLVKTMPAVKVAVGAHSAKLAVPKSWKVGTYRFYVYATDLDGNTQAKVASNRLVVK